MGISDRDKLEILRNVSDKWMKDEEAKLRDAAMAAKVAGTAASVVADDLLYFLSYHDRVLEERAVLRRRNSWCLICSNPDEA